MKILHFIMETSLRKKLLYKRGGGQTLTKADEGGGGVSQMLTIADEGGRGGMPNADHC